MARIKIEMPENILGTVTVPVRITDINYGNHVGNDSLVSIVHEARMLWLCNHGFTEMNAAGTGLIMGDLAIQFLGESFYGDLLNISIAAAEISKASFELYYSIETNRNGKKILIAKAKTGMVCYDYSLKKVVFVPEGLKKILEKL